MGAGGAAVVCYPLASGLELCLLDLHVRARRLYPLARGESTLTRWLVDLVRVRSARQPCYFYVVVALTTDLFPSLLESCVRQ